MTIEKEGLNCTPARLEKDPIPCTIENLRPGYWALVQLSDMYEDEEGNLMINASATFEDTIPAEKLAERPEPFKFVEILKMPEGIVVNLTSEANQKQQRSELDAAEKVRSQLGENTSNYSLPVVGLIRNPHEYYLVASDLQRFRNQENSYTYAASGKFLGFGRNRQDLQSKQSPVLGE